MPLAEGERGPWPQWGQASPANESYDVQILDGTSVKRTLTSSIASVLYTAAQQTADWGAPLGPSQTLSLRIFQLSNRLGRGTPATVTLQF